MLSRQLSLFGKTILINTLILAKTTFLSNIFSTPQITIHKIHKINFQYLWQNKTPEAIARKTLFLAKSKGSLYLKEIEAHNFAMRTKHLLSLKQKENQPPWMCLAIYWVEKDIYNYYQEFRHIQNNNIKTNKMPRLYYRDIIYQIKTQNPNIPNLKNETETIYKEILEKGSQNHTISGEKKWKEKITNIEFNKIWKNTYLSYSKPYTKDLLFKILHYATQTNNYVYRISRNKTDIKPYCDYCNLVEDNIHLLQHVNE